MFYEYALEPELLNNWKDFRYFFENMGISKGQFISRYPKHWKRLVYESLKDCRDVERKKIEEALVRTSNKLLARQNQWDNTQDWFTNAEIEHLRRPFYAIIARNNPNGNNAVLIGDELDDQNPLWGMEVMAYIPRNASDMAESVALLLRASRKLIFIDPHFGPENARYRRPLKGFIEVATRNRTVPIDGIEYHMAVGATKEFFVSECAEKLPEVIPSEYEVHFKRWRQVPEGEKLHDRFILTELGGVEFSVGLDDGSAGETTKVQILSDKSYTLTWDKYLSENPAYEFVDDVIVKGTRR